MWSSPGEKMIAITQRVTVCADSGERRDALAQDWGKFMATLAAPFVPLPNQPALVLALAARLPITALIISGGEDKGVSPERDGSEDALINWALAENIPLLGVCRGLQSLQLWLGGELRPSTRHRACSHALTCLADKREREVNSYHNWVIMKPAPQMKVLAQDPDDGSVEAAQWKNWLGIMWHPERCAQPDTQDLQLFRKHLKL
jgi:putative glutamine amidotransferase